MLDSLTLFGSCMMRCRYRRRKTDARNLSRGQHWPLPEPCDVGVNSFEIASCDSNVGTDAAHDLCGSVRAGAAATVPKSSSSSSSSSSFYSRTCKHLKKCTNKLNQKNCVPWVRNSARNRYPFQYPLPGNPLDTQVPAANLIPV